ncbi:unnamed protein product [Pelagomonas calceolata]|uniref:Uncharacterized protein n=1 Tax=Pelagomonas calceolata TaxID=35677 RepID=A0A8J2SZB7_9STRA|nr:unnamed protein product [Pelagomonas calceolata]
MGLFGAKKNKSLEDDLATLRKLRDDDASGALKKFFGDGEDPREWKYGRAVRVQDGRVTGFNSDNHGGDSTVNNGDSTGNLNLEIVKQLEMMQKTLDSVKEDTSSILRLSEEHRDELRQTRSTLIRAVFDATEVSTPTAFVILKKKLPTGQARVELTLNDDGTGFAVEGKAVAEAKERYEEGKTWMGTLAKFGRGVMKCNPKTISDAVHKACDELVVGEEMWLYLVDELTGKPVVPEGESIYPIRITKPAEVVSKLLPVMQVGLHAASLVNGVAGVVRCFGYPCPKVPEAWRAGAQDSVEILKQESSVEAFGAVHEEVLGGGEETKTTRGAALRELKTFFAERDKQGSYAGLRRIGDDDGTAVWTLLTDPEEVKAAIEKRAAQRRVEMKQHDVFVATALSDGSEEASQALAERVAAIAESRAAAPASGDAAAPAWAARFEARMMKIEEKLDASLQRDAARGSGVAGVRALS